MAKAKGKSQAQQAADAANAALAPQEQGIADLQAQAAQQQAAELASVLGITNASADMAKAYQPAVQSGYTHAALTQAGIAKGFSDNFRAAENQQAQDINAFLSQQGAPSGQYLQGDRGAADVMFGIGGYIPASTFNREGAAFGAAAARYPQTVMGIGMAYQAQVNKRYADLQTQYANELKQIKAQYPQLYNQALGQLQDAAQQQAELDFKKRLAAQEFGLDVYKAKNQAAYQKGNLTLKAQSQKSLNAYRAAQIELKEMGLNISVAKLKQQSKQWGLTPNQYLKLQQNAGTWAQQWRQGKTDKDGNVQGRLTYKQAIAAMVSRGVPKKMAIRTLNQWYAPGVGGRPKKKRWADTPSMTYPPY